MTDPRWDDVLWSIDSAARHFGEAVSLFDEDKLGTQTREGYRAEMAFMHAMQSGYTSFENALTRTMTLLGEERPVGADWHRVLVERSSRAIPSLRPPILPESMLPLVRRVRSFRHWAAHGYDEPFDPEEAGKAVSAARQLIDLMRPTFESFARAVDP